MTTATLPSRLLSHLPSLPVRGAVWPHVLGTLVCTGTALWLHALTVLLFGQLTAGGGLLPEPLTSLHQALDAGWRGLALFGLAWSVWALRERPRWRVAALLLVSLPLALFALVVPR